ncbi:MAG: hypothetical protein U1G07_22700 [Verrucomicrobiota bacterium]
MNNASNWASPWQMYALDHNDWALGPHALDGATIPPVRRDRVPDGVAFTNSPTYKYVGSMESFRCAADRSKLRYQNKLVPRVISYAANAFLGEPSGYVTRATAFKPARRLADLTGPGPSEIYILLDEHENSINDAHYYPFDNLTTFSRNVWLDAPSGRHGNAGGFVFADGHAEIRKWKTPGLATVKKANDGSTPRPYPDLPFIGASELSDYQWITNRIAARR